jgi:hypothetical protein
MCREQLPVWQQFYAKHKSQGVEVLSVAVDAQGPDKARPFVNKARPDFPTVLDQTNLLSRLFGFKVVPNVVFIDKQGVIRYAKYGGFDIRKPEFAKLAEQWAVNGSVDDASENKLGGADHSKAVILFQQGEEHYRQGRVSEALALWRQAVALEPDNYVIRKQIWAVENPDKFYSGDVDYDWQRQQIDKGL